MATATATLPAVPAVPAASAPALPEARPVRRAALPASGTGLILLFTAALLVGLVPIAAVIASPTWVLVGVALATNLLLTLAVLAIFLRFLES